MPDSVYKIIEVVGSSPKSWEDAAAIAVRRASSALRDLRIAEVTAQRHFADQGISDLAKAEATQADAATHEQVPAVPVTPIKRKRGRPRKTGV